MDQCPYCQRKFKRCACQERSIKVMKKIRRTNIVRAHLVGDRLLLQLYQVKGNRLVYVQLSLNSPRKAWLLTEKEYKDLIGRTTHIDELFGSAEQVDYCENLNGVLFCIQKEGYKRFFQFDGRINELAPTQYSVILKAEALSDW